MVVGLNPLLAPIKYLDTSKAAGIDKILSKLMKIEAGFLTLFLIAAINEV